MEVDELVLALAQEEVERTALNGVNLWEIPKVLAEQYNCECCGKACFAGRGMIGRAFTCGSNRCKQTMFQRRKDGTAPDRPLWAKNPYVRDRGLA